MISKVCRGRRRAKSSVVASTLVAAAAFGGAAGGCGYRPLYGGRAPEQKLAVAAAPALIPEADVVHAALAGARDELVRSGLLRSGTGYPQLVVQVLRVDERAAGIAALEASDGTELPLARASSVGVLGRAWVLEAAGAPPTRDTGDVRRVEQYASAAGALGDAAGYDQATRAAGRALGRALARYIVGEPVPGSEPL